MKVVIAGGSGLVGRAVCAELVARGHEPVILTRDADREGSDEAGVRAVPWTPGTGGPWTEELVGAGAVINLAGASIGRWPWTRGRKRELVDSRITATRTLVEAIAALPESSRPRVLLNASGSDLYEGHDATPATEDTPPADTFLARLVRRWEAEAVRAEPLGVRVVLMRANTVIARGAPALRILALPFRLFVGGRLGSGRQWVAWVDLEDVAGLYAWALERDDIRGPLNVAAPDPRTQAEFAKALGAALHRPSWFPTPAWPIRLLLGGQAALALGSRRTWPAKALAGGYVFRRPRLEDSLEAALGRRTA